jgi:hypothetical protein
VGGRKFHLFINEIDLPLEMKHCFDLSRRNEHLLSADLVTLFTHGLTHYRNFLSCWNDPSATSLYFEPVNAPGIFIPSDTYKAESAFLRLRAVSLFPKCDIELESFSNSPGFTGMEE